MTANYEIINIGALPNDGSGDPLRVAFAKINNNFANAFAVGTQLSNAYSFGNTPGQVIFETPVEAFTQGIFQIRSTDVESPDSQEVQLIAQINNFSDAVKFTAHGTTFFGNCLTRYDMDVADGNVRVLVDPLLDVNIFHFISSQVTYQGPVVGGMGIQLNGYEEGNLLATENSIAITTEQSA